MIKEFTFKYNTGKGGVYFLTVLFGVPFGILLPSLFLMEYVSWILWITVPLGVGVIVYCIRKFIKKISSTDTIHLDNLGFTSKDYGRILYSEIHSIPPYGALQAAPPSMRIKLHNGKKLVWIFNPQSLKSQNDIAIFTAFREKLLEYLKHQTQMPAAATLAAITGEKALGTAESGEQQEPQELTRHSAEVIEQLENHKKRDFNYKYITIPIGLAFAVLMFVRTCGEDWIREHRENEFGGVRNAILHMEADYEENMQEAKRAAAVYSRKFGPVFLFTNDPQGEVEFIPDIEKDPYMPEINVVGLRRAEDNKQLEKFIQHPDSANYLLAVVNRSMEFLTVMNNSVFSREDSTATTVYFSLYNPHESLPSKFNIQSDTAFHPIQYNTSIAVPKVGRITKDFLNNMDFAAVRAVLQKYNSTYFYMVAKEQDGIQPERFDELKAVVKADLEEHGIAIENFRSRRFNTN